MAKRFNDTDIWKKQRWFRKLKPEYKLAFYYIKDQCNHAGIWEVDCSDLIEDLGLVSFNINDFLDAINTEYDKISGEKVAKERIILLQNSQLWVTGFIQFQYEGKDRLIKSSNNLVKGALFILDNIKFNPYQPLPTLANPCDKITLLEQALNKLYIKSNQGLADMRQGLATLKEREKEKDKVMDKDKVIKKENEEKIELKNSNLFRQPNIPTLQEVIQTFVSSGGTTEMAENFFNKYDGVGWFRDNTPIMNYKNFVSSYISNWLKNESERKSKKTGNSSHSGKPAKYQSSGSGGY